jgi:hypothetical protein
MDDDPLTITIIMIHNVDIVNDIMIYAESITRVVPPLQDAKM